MVVSKSEFKEISCSERKCRLLDRYCGFWPPLINVSLRFANLGSRFFLIFFLAKLVTPADLGLYGLVTATIGYSLYLVGLDFYIFTTRELVKHGSQGWGGVLKNHAALSLGLYAVVLPALTLIFTGGLLPWHLSRWFYLLVILEHINQEMGRLFVAISDQLYASILLFFRQGTWAIAVTVLMLIRPSSRNLDTIFAGWTISGGLAILFGLHRLYKHQVGGWNKRVDWRWIFQGIKVSVPFLIATLALRGIFTVDRYWVQSLANLEGVGAYVLFLSLSSTMMTFLDAGVFSFSYPALIEAYQKNVPDIYRMKMREMLIHAALILIVFSILSLVLLPHLLNWIGNPVYIAYEHIYIWLLIVMILYSLSMIPHYALYAQNQDRPIIQSHICGLIIFITATWLFSKYFPNYAVPAGLCCSFTVVLFWKTFAFIRLTPVGFKRIWIN